MKDFCAGSLKTSGFCFALDDYRALIGEERFKVLKVNYGAFILDEDDTMPSIKVVLDLMIWEDFNVIIIDINRSNNSVVADILKYMEQTNLYVEMESYEDRLCFGMKAV